MRTIKLPNGDIRMDQRKEPIGNYLLSLLVSVLIGLSGFLIGSRMINIEKRLEANEAQVILNEKEALKSKVDVLVTTNTLWERQQGVLQKLEKFDRRFDNIDSKLEQLIYNWREVKKSNV